MKNKNEIEIIKNKIKNKNQLFKTNLQITTIIKAHNDNITSIANFPNGNFISLSWDKSIKIFDKLYRTIQHIENAHDDWVRSVAIENDTFFITCSLDCSIKSWFKNGNLFQNHQIIKKAHILDINKIILSSNGYLFSCSDDRKLKIWKKKDNNMYESFKCLEHSTKIYSLLLIEDKNKLISTGHYETKFWDLDINNINNIKFIKNIDDTYCECRNVLNRMDEDKVIIGGKDKSSLKIISISTQNIIYTISIPFQCLGIRTIYDKGVFFVGGYRRDLLIFRCDNYEMIQKVNNAHDEYIEGITELSNGFIATHGWDHNIKIWQF